MEKDGKELEAFIEPTTYDELDATGELTYRLISFLLCAICLILCAYKSIVFLLILIWRDNY
jgi:hypothetical protein